LAQAVKEIGKNLSGVQGNVSNLADLDRLFAQIKREKGRLDIVFECRVSRRTLRFFSSSFRSFSANPFANVGRTVRDSAVFCFEISQECDYLAIDEPNSFQIENHRSVVTFDQPF
jgi:NAD(P)-dependent dehydrogenase (short-subunit alcohol dehydrogenase family)